MTERQSCSKSISGKETDWVCSPESSMMTLEAAPMSDGNGQAAGYKEWTGAQTRGNEGAMKYMTALSQNSATAKL